MLLLMNNSEALKLPCLSRLNKHKSRFIPVGDWDSLSSAGLAPNKWAL
jgi:hypothetical protein